MRKISYMIQRHGYFCIHTIYFRYLTLQRQLSEKIMMDFARAFENRKQVEKNKKLITRV